jgi:hypothetical protein
MDKKRVVSGRVKVAVLIFRLYGTVFSKNIRDLFSSHEWILGDFVLAEWE